MRLTKQIKETGLSIAKQHGYWSKELNVFNGALDYDTMRKLQVYIKIELKEVGEDV